MNAIEIKKLTDRIARLSPQQVMFAGVIYLDMLVDAVKTAPTPEVKGHAHSTLIATLNHIEQHAHNETKTPN